MNVRSSTLEAVHHLACGVMGFAALVKYDKFDEKSYCECLKK